MAKTIMSLHLARDIKTAAKDLPKSEDWNDMCPGVLMELNKFDQKPDLKQRLIDTAPHKLVEATVNAKWGRACPKTKDRVRRLTPSLSLCSCCLVLPPRE